MDRQEFLTEAQRRGYRREWIYFYPGPDQQRDPEGGVVIAAPRDTEPRWRTYRMDHGVRDEAFFADESDAYEYVLATVIGAGKPGSTGSTGPLDREQFLAEVERRGGKRSWFLFYPGPDEQLPAEGRVVIEQTAEPGDGPWRVYRHDRGVRDVEVFGSESEALRPLLDALPGRP